jgi:hypothetical protein
MMVALNWVGRWFGRRASESHNQPPKQPPEQIEGTFSREGDAARSAYFQHKGENEGKPERPLTPLQRRMHSGGA